jgi:hypothetical protein
MQRTFQVAVEEDVAAVEGVEEEVNICVFTLN